MRCLTTIRRDVSKDHCLSFSCYPFNDCVDYIRARSQDPDQPSSYEKLCRSVVMKWPKDGRLWAELVNSNGVHKVSMSPPYLVSFSLMRPFSHIFTFDTSATRNKCLILLSMSFPARTPYIFTSCGITPTSCSP